TVGDVDPDFLNEASFRTNSVQITDQKHFEQHDRIDARTPIILTIQGAAFFRDKRKVDGFIDFSKQVILGNKVFYVDCFGLKFPGWVRPEHIKTFLRNCFIPNSTKKAVDPSLSPASTSPVGLVFLCAHPRLMPDGRGSGKTRPPRSGSLGADRRGFPADRRNRRDVPGRSESPSRERCSIPGWKPPCLPACRCRSSRIPRVSGRPGRRCPGNIRTGACNSGSPPDKSPTRRADHPPPPSASAPDWPPAGTPRWWRPPRGTPDPGPPAPPAWPDRWAERAFSAWGTAPCKTVQTAARSTPF